MVGAGFKPTPTLIPKYFFVNLYNIFTSPTLYHSISHASPLKSDAESSRWVSWASLHP